ncbi:hypothetical protein [Shewanella sp.]|uniref:hypothetical protein n=1 Tax=Shewanella sp. TaxID=50422 RepID=UPI003D0CB226
MVSLLLILGDADGHMPRLIESHQDDHQYSHQDDHQHSYQHSLNTVINIVVAKPEF